MKTKTGKIVKAMVMAAVVALTGAAVADTWEDPDTGITWTYEVDDGEVYIGDDTGCAVDPKPSGVVKIPSVIASKNVVAIGDRAFEGCDAITKVLIPRGVRSIGYSAFSSSDTDSYPYCTALELVTIPSSVEYIGACAFYGCTAMADENGFIIVNDVLYQYVGTSASVTVPAGVKEISESAFDDCDFITSLTLPGSLVRIGENAFQACTGLTGLTIPASVREIGDGAFLSCVNLSITIPDTVTDIGDGAFYNCGAMADANGFVIVRSALHFFDVLKSSATDIYIPSGVTLICSEAFFKNGYIKSVTIPYGVQRIGPRAFYGCSILTDMEIPESVEKIGRDAFRGSALNKVYVVPDDTDRVRDLIRDSRYANADSIDFEEDVTPSEEYRTEIVGGIEWKYHIVEGGAEIHDEDDYAAIDNTTAGAITVPSTLGGFPVVSIGAYAFEYCDALTAVNIPASVRNIGYGAFQGCTAMSSVALPVGLQTIDEYAFYDCANLSGVSIPDGVEYIGDGAFYGCAAMADANGFVIVRDVLHYYAGSAANVAVPAGVKAIGESAFDNNDALKSVTIPDGVTEIGSSAFSGCENLASVSIPDSVEDIGSAAFRGCDAMADANGFVIVRRILYHYAGSAASVTVPSGVQAISSGAFRRNTSITSVFIPSGVRTIGGTAFAWCENLASISIQKSVVGIGKGAFAYSALATVHVAKGDTTRMAGLIEKTSSNLDALAFYEDLPTETVCTVTLDANGGTCDTPSIACISGQEIGELPVAYKSGYTFTGWYTFKVSGGVQLTPDKVVTSSSTYYARFEEKPPEYLTETVDGIEWTYCVVDGKAKISNGNDSAVPTTTFGEVTVPAMLGGYPVTRIGDYAFASCSSITKVTIPSGVTGIGNFVFHSASSLKDLFIPKTVTDFSGNTFLTSSIDTIHVEKGDIDRVRTLIEATGYTSFDYDDGSVSPAPANDMFANATTISGVSGSVSGSNVDATFEAGEPLYVWKVCEATVWWTWTAPASGTVTFDTIGSTVDTVMGAYTGDAVASLTTMAEDDDSGGDSKSKISFSVVKDTTYRIAVATYGNGAGGDLTLTWSLSVPTSVIVTFDGNGGDSDEPTRELPSGSAIGALPTAEWSGHTFLGWFTDSAGGDKIDASTTVFGDATYYAHWEEDAPPPDYATILGAPAGLSFSSTGDKPWVDGGTVDGKAAVKSGDIGDSQSSTLTATFSGAGTLSFFYKVESEGSYDMLRIYIDGENLDNYSGTVSWTKYEKELSEGSHTVSWEYSKDSSNSTGLDSAWIANVGFESDTTVYTVTFEKNGGDSVSESSREVEEDMTVGIPLPEASWAGHTFDGWFTKASGGTQIDGTETVTGDVTYYAHWTEIETEYKTWTDPGTGIAWTYRVVDGEAEIYNDDNAAIPDTTAGAITVPSTLGGYPVTRIGDWAFDGCELLTSVTIPSGVTIIGEVAFSECYGLESVSLPEGLETIDDGAFQFCESLETISIPSTVTGIGDDVFQDCYALADSDGFIVVSGILFDYTGAGGDITIPSTVKTIWDGALYYTASLTGVTIPGSVKTVGYDAFGDSANLASVTFGRGVKTIGEVAFIRCAALTEARIPASVTSIGESAFGETALNKVYVEYGDTARVKALLEASYFDTTGVEFVEDAEPLVCTVTLELNGGSGVETSFDVDPGETIGLLPIPEGPEGQNGFQGWFWDSDFTDEVEPTDEVNGDCTCYAKWGGAVAVETTLVDGVAWSYFVDGKKKVVLYNNGRTVIPSDYEGALVIPSKIAGKSVVGIGERAFYGCTGLTSVIIPDGVNDINDKAFAWCESLQVVQFGKGVSKGTIFFYVFKGCEWLKVLDFKGTTPPTVANYSAFEDAGTMTLEGKPIVYVPKSAAKKWGSEWTGMRVMPYSYSANIVMRVRPGKETYGSITPVVSGKATEIGKKVALKAKASSKAYVFAGWYDLGTGLRVSRSASYSYLVTGEDKSFEANFVDVVTDIDSLGIDVGDVWTDDDGTTFIDIGAAVSSWSEPKITVKGLPSGLKYDSKTQKISGQAKKPGVYKVTVTASNLSQKKAQTAEFELVVPNWTCEAMPKLEPDPDDYGTVWCGVAFDNDRVDCTPALGWTVKASGLPTGLKWTDKVVFDKKTGAVIAKANSIYGVPTKPGNYTVTFTATRLREKQTATITLKVVARPEWAAGTFNGGSDFVGAQFGKAGAGQATLTIAANGKISGKVLSGGKTWTISAASFDHGDHGEYIAHVTAKSGKEERTETILLEMYGLNEVGGMVTASGDLGALVLYQTNWKADPWKTIAKNDAFKAAIKSELPYSRSDAGEARDARLSLKFAASGAVTVKGEFNIGGAVYKGSASATLVPLTEPDTTSNGAFTGEVCAYIPPKDGKFVGYFERLKVKWTGMAFLLDE